MTEEEDTGPKTVKFHRIVPQIKTFKKGTLLKNKVDLYYSLEEDIVETGNEDGWSPLMNPGTPGNHNSFAQGSEFIAKESNLLFAEAAQFRADDGNVYIRAQLLHGEKVVWVNVLAVPNRLWAFKIRHEQKKMIKEEIESMFEVLLDGTLTN
jgi:hypothetical protein